MMTLLLAAAALLSNANGPKGDPVTTRRYAQAGWTVEIRRDAFSDQTSCRLSGTRMIYQDGAIGFRSGEHLGLADAWLRIDGEPARRWQELYPRLLSAGVRLETGGLDDPTGGIVWIPVDIVKSAHEVTIEFTSRRRPRLRHFHLGGFAGMRATALRLGCPPDGFQVQPL